MTFAQSPGKGAAKSAWRKNRILGIDDDRVVQVMLNDVLTHAGYHYLSAHDAAEAENLLVNDCFDLVLLDRRLPDSDGLLLIEKIRRKCGSPVIVLSAMNETHDKLLGIGLGAIDYVTKPFSAAELCSRISRHLKRFPARQNTIHCAPIEGGGLRFVPGIRLLTIDGKRTILPPSEARLLQVLMENIGMPLSRDILTNATCGRDWSHGDRTVDVLVSRLRRRLKPGRAELVTLHGTGYTLLIFDEVL